MTEKTIKLSVNTAYENKQKPEDHRFWSGGFQAVELTLADLAKSIQEGWAFSYQFADGVRKTGNFLATDFLAVDIDDGMNLVEANENPYIQKYCSLIYTTPSHTPDRHRFRLVFVLPHTLTKVQEVRAASRSLARLLGGDPAATDGARMFYGSTNCLPIIKDEFINEEFLSELIDSGIDVPNSESISYSGQTANRSTKLLEPDTIFTNRYGHKIALKDVKETTSVHCLFHKDDRPSAFVSKTKKGSRYLHCSSCQMTWWMKGGSSSSYRFDSFEIYARGVKDGTIQIAIPEEVPLANVMTLQSLQGNTIFISSNQHLSISELKDGLTLIKSPKGSGKTTYLSTTLPKLFNNYASLPEYENDCDIDDDKPIFSKENILLIGHRQALIGDLCNRLALNCYLDDNKSNPRDLNDRKKRYGVCLDSLWKVEDDQYDLIVIDEVEQVLNHFLSDTLKSNRLKIFRIFSNLVQRARKIVVLDADLGWVTFSTLTMLTNDVVHLNNHDEKANLGKQQRTPVYLYINDWKSDGRTIHIHPSSNQVIDHLRKSVIAGKRVFVATNSKKKVKALEKAITNLAARSGKEVPCIAITSDNSNDKDVQKFIENIKTEIKKYKVVLSSPSLGTGIDITFDNEAREIDCVYGLFENQINSHFEIDQQLARVRHPKEVHVWVSPQRFQFETEFGVVTDDCLKSTFADASEHGYLIRGKRGSPDDVHPFYTLAAMLTSLQRASKNKLKSNFIKYKKSQNWRVIFVDEDEDSSLAGQTFYQSGEKIAAKEAINNILNARTLNQVEYEIIRNRLNSNDDVKDVNQDELSAYRRTNLERFYRVPVDRDLIAFDDDGRTRRRVRLFESIKEKPSFLERKTLNESGNSKKTFKEVQHRLRLFQDNNAAAVLLYNLLSLTPVFHDGKFDCDVFFTTSDVQYFAKQCRELQTHIVLHLECQVRSDVDEKPVQQLGALLKTIGIGFDKSVKPRKVNGNKITPYKLDKNSVDAMVKTCKRRSDVDGWKFINDHYGFQYSESELEELI